jgi:DNA topoisomerase-3
VCGRDVIENRKGYSCWSREDPGCGFVIWKRKAGKSLGADVARELIASLRASREAGEDPGVGRTEKQVTGFRGRSGRTFRAKLKIEQDAETGKWRVDFDEDWAKEPAERAPDGVAAAAGDGGAGNGAAGDGAAGDGASARPAARRGGRRRQTARRG